jgi:uncharacterized membrane protein
MIREAFKEHGIGMNKEFRHRGVEPGRLENFSDAVFALAITLLLISTSPPTSFIQIKKFLFDLIPFVLCITLIVSIWHQHFTFYYRYGLRHGSIIVLNTAFLIIVLFYVYPLKFLTKLFLFPIASIFNIDWLLQDLKGLVSGNDIGDLMIIYGLGATSTSFVLMLMYRYALKKKDELQLNEIEVFDTRTSMQTNFLIGIIPLISAIVAFIFRGHWVAGLLAGCTYILYAPIMGIHSSRVDKHRAKLLKELEPAHSEQQLTD